MRETRDNLESNSASERGWSDFTPIIQSWVMTSQLNYPHTNRRSDGSNKGF